MASFEADGLVFHIDRAGITLSPSQTIDIAVDWADLGVAAEQAPTELAARLSRLTGEAVEDEEGIFDLAVTQAGKTVAALVLACEDDALELAGERAPEIDDEALARAVIAALAG